MSANQNPMLQNLRHLTQKFDDLGEQMNNFNKRQTDGEAPDPSEFSKLLEKRSVTHMAMEAQFSLMQKPLKAVLNDAK